MKKIETIWHHILFSALENDQFRFTQQELARYFGYSLSTVNYALNTPSQIGAIRKESKFFVLENFTKLLYYWASMRNLSHDIIYKTYFSEDVIEIEKLIISQGIYGCYSAARKILSEAPADYAKIYIYIEEKYKKEIKERFPEIKDKDPNVFVLKAPPVMKDYGMITTLPQTFVDIWNLKDWYSQDFIKILENRINEKISK